MEAPCRIRIQSSGYWNNTCERIHIRTATEPPDPSCEQNQSRNNAERHGGRIIIPSMLDRKLLAIQRPGVTKPAFPIFRHLRYRVNEVQLHYTRLVSLKRKTLHGKHPSLTCQFGSVSHPRKTNFLSRKCRPVATSNIESKIAFQPDSENRDSPYEPKKNTATLSSSFQPDHGVKAFL